MIEEDKSSGRKEDVVMKDFNLVANKSVTRQPTSHVLKHIYSYSKLVSVVVTYDTLMRIMHIKHNNYHIIERYVPNELSSIKMFIYHAN